MFGEDFWKQAVIVFTRLPMDRKSVSRRTKNAHGKTDADLGMQKPK